MTYSDILPSGQYPTASDEQNPEAGGPLWPTIIIGSIMWAGIGDLTEPCLPTISHTEDVDYTELVHGALSGLLLVSVK